MTEKLYRLSAAADLAPETLVPGEAAWREHAASLLDKLYRRRAASRDDFLIFEAGVGYLQFVAPADGHHLVCEVASARDSAELKAMFTPQKEQALLALGFEKGSPNYSVNVEID